MVMADWAEIFIQSQLAVWYVRSRPVAGNDAGKANRRLWQVLE